ncbi:MAG: hypothetical protein KY453_03970, partial [Gemmatimonadetes bacterium]|nr:hypothetical protein [Gemmatimonadota bacterium]
MGATFQAARPLCLSAVALALLLPPALAAQDQDRHEGPSAVAGERASTHAAAPSAQARALGADESIGVDGVLDEAAWRAALPVTGFTQLDPVEGAPATEPTDVRILYDEDALYIAATLYDS